jgi:L-lysine exporter family protein LysE/ArgO
LAIGPQNLFVIEQGLKKNFIFTITSICAVSDVLLIFLGIFIYNFFDFIFWEVEVILNIILVLFLTKFIKDKIDEFKARYKIKNIKKSKNLKNIILKTLGFTYLNPHVYSDTVFILGNLSKNFKLEDKFYFALGASLASIIFFYSLGYMSSMFAGFIKKKSTWKYINTFIITFMSILLIYISYDTYTRLINT